MRLIGLIDVDGHNYPNLCIMKLSAYHKSIGDEVEWWDSNEDKHYDIVYMSKVFSDAYSPDLPTPQNATEVIRGGTGYAIKLEDGKEVYHKELDPPLPSEIENIYPDYSLYPEHTGFGQPLKKQTAYGFLTRGCPRGCGFCHVGAKEGRCARRVADLSQFWNGQGTICLSDPNVLACPQWTELLTQLVDSKAKIDFNQGLDARLITPQKAELLARMNLKTPHFAMDTMESLEPVKKGIKLYVDACKRIKGKWNWRNAKVFCLTNFNTSHEQDMERIKAIQECECQPYVMIYNKPSAPPITRRLQMWTNSTMFYAKTKDFMEYQRMNYKSVIESTPSVRKRIIRNFDGASYYPNLMIKCGYTSRNIPSPKIFEDVVARRLEAKKSGDKTTANALKLVVNTTYGAMLNQYNDLYDPSMGRSVCITGQLFLLELSRNLYQNIEDLRIVQLNTDGVMIEFYEDQYEQVQEIVNEWQSRTGFELEEDSVALIAQKDVNNYVDP